MTIEPRHTPRRVADRQKAWQPAFTEPELRKARIADNPTISVATVIAENVAQMHENQGTPRAEWEPDENTIRIITIRFADAASALLGKRLAADVDPVLDGMQDTLSAAESALEELETLPRPVTTSETGTTYPGREAAEVHAEHAETVNHEIMVEGKGHHNRAPRGLKLVGRLSPWLEAAGLASFLLLFLNVNLLAPWEDPFGTTIAITVTAVLILGQTFFVEIAGRNHNRARDEESEGNRHEALRFRSTRNRALLAAVLVATGITAALVLRGTAALGDADTTVMAVMVGLAILTGYVMPALGFLAVALDGSKLSRERDELAAGLEDDFQESAVLTEETAALLASATDDRDRLVTAVLPTICADVQARVDESHVLYDLVRTQIGGLSLEPPLRTRRRFGTVSTAEGDTAAPESVELLAVDVVGEISTGLPGGAAVDLLPLVDRVRRLHTLETERQELAARLAKVPPHPWDTHTV